MFAVSDVSWTNRFCLEANAHTDFIVDGHTELVLLDGNPNTCLPLLNSNWSYTRLDVYVYTPMTKHFVLEMSVTDLRFESQGMLVYFEQKCANGDDGSLIQCLLDDSNRGAFSCRFACISSFQLKTKTRVVIQIDLLPWELVVDPSEPKVYELTTIAA